MMYLIQCEKCKGNRVISKKNKWKCMECRYEWELNEMPTKHIMTRAEAINLVKDKVFGMVDTGQAARWADFFIAAGMLEIKEEEDKPIFELKYPSGVHTYKIWADGRIEGFNEGVVVINRIPKYMADILKQNNS